MRNRFDWKRLAACVCALLLWCAGAAAEKYEQERTVTLSSITAEIPAQGSSVTLRLTEINGETWLFLPAFAPMEETVLLRDGQPLAWEEAGEAEDGSRLIQAGETEITVMQSENLRALFLLSDDPVNEGREYIDNCEKHERSTSASMALVDAEGHVDHAGKIRKLRGRGNGTWGGSSKGKNPYQFKLKEKTDLLDTGIAQEAARTWVLLAESSDATHLRNRITLDMGLELGLSQTAHSEHIDLYYDGEYRGTYLLTEKSEIGEGRVDEVDYDKLIETWNEKAGQTDLDSLPVAEGVNARGNPYTYIDGVVETESHDAGAYMVEMESAYTLSDRCWFELNGGSMIACKNPENATQRMMEYISVRLQEAYDTLADGGVNTQNGRTLAEDFDLEAFARTLLVQEWSYNYDGYRYSSSWFVLPAGESRFKPGPLWDFDLAYRYMADGTTADGAGFKEQDGWMGLFYQCEDYLKIVRRIYVEELYPLVQGILLGDGEGAHLRSLDAYEEEIAASRRMNEVLWPRTDGGLNRYLYGSGYEGEMALLRQFITERTQWLYDTLREDGCEDEAVVLWANATYAHTEETLTVTERLWNPAKVQSASWEQLSEATEEEYAQWQLEIYLQKEAGAQISRVLLNGTELTAEETEDGLLCVRAVFEDPSYRPVDYYGEDIGLVYNPAVYAQNYPEIAEMYEDDPEGLMDYFCDDGMYEDQMGNAFFRPSEVLTAYPELEYTLGEDWQLYYWEYISYGHLPDKWMTQMNKRYWPDVSDAL